ncbi:hypothetical protein GN286_05130 [Rhodobacteraceae bacterium IMCC15231]|nr:hypothetical protein [Rhodobacteraceae bacterium IMCC15231]
MSSIGIVSRLLTSADLQEYLSTKSFLDQADLSDSKVEERPDGTEYAAYA